MNEIINRPSMVKITKIEDETPSIKTFYLETPKTMENASPGQFIMAWIPDIDEIPLSLSGKKPKLALSVKKIGDATAAFHNLKVGDRIGVRGPYGHGFSLKKGTSLIVGGGIGMAPFLFLIDELFKFSKKITVINGAQTKHELLYLDKLQKSSRKNFNYIFTTDDGSFGEKGFASSIAIQKLQETSYDQVYTCGPEPMIWDLFQFTEKLKIPMQASLERLIKCGIGLCGQCSLDPLGYRICVEGPVLSSETLRKLTDFGKYKRDLGGHKIPL
jgi:dihydroorotate dehydrogenase electron transfer subunit